MSNLKDNLQDTLNPIFFNDLRKTRKALDFWLNVFFLLITYSVVFYILLISPNKSLSDYEFTCYRVMSFFFMIGFIVIPVELYKRCITETNNENIYFIFMSNITANKFIRGKILLGFFYHAILLLAAFLIYVFIACTSSVPFIVILRYFYYTVIAPFPVMMFLIREGLESGKENKISQFVNGFCHFAFITFEGYLIISLVFVDLILKGDKYTSGYVVADLILSFLVFVISIVIYIFTYSLLTKRYPMSEVTNSTIPRARKGFSFIPSNDDTKSTAINFDNQPKNINEVKKEKSIVIPKETKHEKENNLSNTLNSDDKVNSFSNSNISIEKKNYKTSKIKIRRKERYSSEFTVKIIFTLTFAVALFIILLKTMIGHLILSFSGFAFPLIVSYVHSREKKYDHRSKLEIPASGLKKLIKFPFVSGYANSIVWLTIMCFALLATLYITYGDFDKGQGVYFVNDTFPGGYQVVMAYMLNVSSWCFIGRFIAESFINSKEDRSLPTMLITIVIATFASGLLPKDPHGFTLLNYFSPAMPFMTQYFFFKKPLAFIFNIFFFVGTSLLHIQPLYEQIISYFSQESKFDE